MGIKGFYSYVKKYSQIVQPENYRKKRIGIDTYALLYKFQEDTKECLKILETLLEQENKLYLYVDGKPPVEKQGELSERREKREHAHVEAIALRSFLEDTEKRQSLSKETIEYLEMKIKSLEKRSWYITRDHLHNFLDDCKKINIEIHMCSSEADFELIAAAKKNELDIVISNDMDLFVGGVPYLWILGKTPHDPLFMGFEHTVISEACGIHTKAWADVAILAGYEKAKNLKRCSIEQAVIWIRYYGCLENLFERQKELLGEASLAEYQAARKWLQ
jgi:5'-3' exonuclease